MRRPSVLLLSLLAILAVGTVPGATGAPGTVTAVTAAVETDPVPSSGDAADDPAIWVDRETPSRSVIVATDKQAGLAVYDLKGNQLQFLRLGTPNNVDIRQGFPLGGRKVALVVAADDSDETLRVYRLEPRTRTLVNVAARTIVVGVDAHGICLYRSPVTGKLFAFPNAVDGRTEQWELFDNGSGKVDARKVRGPWDVGGEVEGCVADDALKRLYISEEELGLWRYGAEPGASTSTRYSVDSVSGNLDSDVEGLAIASTGAGDGYLIASSQGDHSFVVYQRGGANAFVKRFQVTAGTMDGCEDTDGIEVTTRGLGAAFPEGLFVCQDGSNPGANQNFKLVRLDQII